MVNTTESIPLIRSAKCFKLLKYVHALGPLRTKRTVWATLVKFSWLQNWQNAINVEYSSLRQEIKLHYLVDSRTMLENTNLLEKIGADTPEKKRNFATILKKKLDPRGRLRSCSPEARGSFPRPSLSGRTCPQHREGVHPNGSHPCCGRLCC